MSNKKNYAEKLLLSSRAQPHVWLNRATCWGYPDPPSPKPPGLVPYDSPSCLSFISLTFAQALLANYETHHQAAAPQPDLSKESEHRHSSGASASTVVKMIALKKPAGQSWYDKCTDICAPTREGLSQHGKSQKNLFLFDDDGRALL